MNVRNKIYSVLSRDYGRNNIVNHYYDNDKAVPIWAIFELLSLGEFGNFLSCVNVATRKNYPEMSVLNQASMQMGGFLKKSYTP